MIRNPIYILYIYIYVWDNKKWQPNHQPDHIDPLVFHIIKPPYIPQSIHPVKLQPIWRLAAANRPAAVPRAAPRPNVVTPSGPRWETNGMDGS